MYIILLPAHATRLIITGQYILSFFVLQDASSVRSTPENGRPAVPPPAAERLHREPRGTAGGTSADGPDPHGYGPGRLPGYRPAPVLHQPLLPPVRAQVHVSESFTAASEWYASICSRRQSGARGQRRLGGRGSVHSGRRRRSRGSTLRSRFFPTGPNWC
ncbi:hypothetical protein SS50377_22756 [Spironucleus salmonicida]|uniref:Uncharacterized protein n=1 Tax=Spironucleus salmonicida TaxID=348837 RepID=A0A9P8RZL6_9EUKA|nr:hypothetical protein SS50377_22756 [Spironucleus salmonicida]